MAFLVFLVVFLMVLTSEDSELTQTQESCICSVRVPQNYCFPSHFGDSPRRQPHSHLLPCEEHISEADFPEIWLLAGP